MESSDGRLVRKLGLVYVASPDDPSLCDCCNEPKQCARISSLGGDVSVICKDCVGLILSSFGEPEEEEYSYWQVHFYNMEGDLRWSNMRFHKDVEDSETAMSIVRNLNLDDVAEVSHVEPSYDGDEWGIDLSGYEP
jgi:hypothetical protein